MSEKMFTICVDSHCNAEYYYIVMATTKESAIWKANSKFKNLNDVSTASRGRLDIPVEIEFDDDGISQILYNMR